MSRAGARPGSRPRIVVGDMGGSHLRLAWIENGSLTGWQLTEHAVTPPEAALRRFAAKAEHPLAALALAVAGPVGDGPLVLTNHAFTATREELAALVGAQRVLLLNDLAAVAHGLTRFAAPDLQTLLPAEAATLGGPMAVLSIGTGLGVAGRGATGSVIASEGGHAGLAPHDAETFSFAAWLFRRLGRAPELEDALGGQGLVHLALYEAEMLGLEDVPADLTGPQVTDAYRQGAAWARGAVERFASLLAHAARSVAVTMGASGGIVITGGNLRRYLDALEPERFGAVFRAAGPMQPWLGRVKVETLVHPAPELVGLAAALGEPLVSTTIQP